MTRRAVEYIEFDVDWCDHYYGTGFCRAALAGEFVPEENMSYNFNDGSSSVHGFTTFQGSGGPPTIVGGPAYATLSGNGATDQMLVRAATPFSGADVDKIRLNYRRVTAGTLFDGAIIAFTASGWFFKYFTDLAVGVDGTVVVDMSTASPGGGESGVWSAKTFTYFRVDFDQTGSGVIRLYSIELGARPGGAVDRCFNCRNTCQDIARYSPSPTTLRFVKDNGDLSKDIYAQAIIKDISFTPATLSVGKDIGIRATLSVEFFDRPHSDTGPGFDKYYDLRSYNPYEQGTLWGKVRARQPYLVNNVVRYIRGYSDQALAAMESRTFIVTKAEVVGMAGGFVLEAQDALRLTDRSRAQCPVQNNGFLSVDINDTVTSFTLSPTNIGVVEYSAGGYLNIGGKEIVSFEHDKYARLTAASELLLNFNGTDASTTMTDSSGKGRNGTVVGNAQLDTANPRYGTASLLLDGTGDYITIADNNAWTPGTNFTIEAWIYPTDLTVTQRCIASHSTNTVTSEWRLQVDLNGRLNFIETVASVQTISLITSTTGVIQINRWTHVAMVKEGSTWRFFVDGVLIDTFINATALTNFAGNLRVGMRGNGTSQPWIGWIDSLHIASAALWTNSFDPPAPPQASANTMIIGRAQLGTVAQAHSAQDRVQEVTYYISEDPATVINDQLITYSSMPPAWVDLATMLTETGSYLQVNVTGIIPEPTAVDKIIGELCEQFAMSIWWDDLNEVVKLRVLRAITSNVTINDTNAINGTLTIEEQPDKRVTQVWIYYGKINPLESEDKPENYRSVAVTLDLEAESLYGSPSIVKIYSRWIPAGGRSIAQRIGEIILGRYVDPPRMFTFEIMKREEEADLIELGSGIDVQSWSLQLPNGSPETVQTQVIRYDPNVSRQRVEAEEYVFYTSGSFTDRTVIIETDSYNLNARTLFDAIYPEPNGSTVVDIIIESGATVGSTSTALKAFDIGSWPVGATVNLIVNGRIQGKGGKGGSGSASGGSTKNGLPGGVALYTRFPINLSGSGQIYAGGGGGGGGEIGFTTGLSKINGGRGGGGAGTDGGQAGEGNNPNNPGTAEAGGVGGSGQTTGGGSSTGGGNGGGPGASGTSGSGGGAGSGGAAGAAIDGDSYVTETGSLTILTSRIN